MNKRLIFIMGIFIILSFLMTNLSYSISLDDMFGGKSKEYQQMLEEKEKENQKLVDENKSLQSRVDEVEENSAALTRDYKSLEIDRNNLLEQTKILLKEKSDLVAAKEAFEKISEQNRTLLDEKESIQQEGSSLNESLERLKLHLKELTQEKIRLESLLQQAQADHSTVVRGATDKLQDKLKELNAEVKALKKEKIDLTNQLKQTEKDVNILEKTNSKLEDKVDVLDKQLTDLEKNYADMQKENKHLTQEAREFPKQFTDLARQNKRLVEQAAETHYNLGVFYVKNKEYKQAVQEFDKVLEVKPNHAYANYNLGYIYAEYLVDRKKAIEYFKSYLTYAPDAKDADWVRKYILTWQTWYGKENL